MKKNLSAAFFILMLTFMLSPLSSLADAAIPKNEQLVVLASGDDEQHVSTVEAILVDQLLASGYKPADEQKVRQLRTAARKSEAARHALDGNVAALLKLGAKYGIPKFTTVATRIRAGQPVVNEFQLYTGTASISILVTASNGSRLYGGTAQGKAVGYTPDEAAQNAAENAIKSAVKEMTR